MNSNRLFLFVLGIISGVLLLYSKKLNSVTLIFCICNIILLHSITKDINTSIAIAFIAINIALLVTNFTSNKYYVEKFTDEINHDHQENSDDDNENDNDNENENENENDNENNNENDDTDNKDEFILDTKSSFLETYKSLSDKQVAGLNKDTQDLIKTQKQLIETLKNMGPALKDGKEILDTFKNYFGDDSQMNDIVSKFKLGK